MIGSVDSGVILGYVWDYINPGLVGVWLCQLLADFRDHSPNARTYCIATIFAIVVTQYANHTFRASNIFRGNSGFPSGHETFAVSLITSMTLRDWRWGWILSPIALLFGVVLVVHAAHTPLDVVGAVVLTPPFTYLCHKITMDPTLSTA